MDVKKVEKIVFNLIEDLSQSPYEITYYDYEGSQSVFLKIYYSPLSVKLSELKKDEDWVSPCKYDGDVKIKVNQMFMSLSGFDEMDRMYYKDDLPDYEWDDFNQYIDEHLYRYIPHVCVGFETDF